jgi:murein DD-endopeptidase MepM/ murein hydrolase activator NlpD
MVDRRHRARKKSTLEMGGKAPAKSGTLRLFVLLAIMVLVNLYVFVWRDGTSIGDIRKKAKDADVGQTALSKFGTSAASDSATALGDPTAIAAGSAAPDKGGVFEGTVAKNESFGKILRSEVGLAAGPADELIRAVGPVFDFRGLRAGQAWKVIVDDGGRVDSFELVVSKTLTVRAQRDESTGELTATKDEAATRVETQEIGGRIDSSLYASVKAAGADTALVAFFVDVFAYDIDFFNDTQQGDTFKVIVEAEYKDAELLRYRRILAAEYSGKAAGTFRVIYWQAPKGKGRYYDDHGQSVEKSMLKTPLKFARVSSGFNPRRMHPVLHTVRGHFGTDFAAPIGTPVWAAADGVIIGRAPSGGAGNMVTLRHDNGLVTLYMHLSKFAAGQKVGQRVAAKTVIGYVGTTGLSTGPHLHFGVKKNGAYVDFSKLAPTRAGGVARKDMPAFKADVQPLLDRLGAISTTPPAGAAPTAVSAPQP